MMHVPIKYLLLFSLGALFGLARSQYSVNDSLSILPENGRTRVSLKLDGVWLFRLQDDHNDGFKQEWFNLDFGSLDEPVERMPVPSSFNDITQRKNIRDYAGWVWYQTRFVTPSLWPSEKSSFASVLRFGSVNYQCQVFLNGVLVTQHVGGHLPFQALVTSLLKPAGEANLLTVAVNNELSGNTLPPGTVWHKPDYEHPGRNVTEMIPNFDFFPYSGIHRSVWLSAIPDKRIVDLTIRTDVQSSSGVVEYCVRTNDKSPGSTKVMVVLLDKSHRIVAEASGPNGTLSVAKAKLWYPFPGVGNEAPGYRYKMIVELYEGKVLLDSIEQHVGIRKIELKSDGFHVNDRLTYLRGFGRHEDEVIRGRGLSPTTLIKDFNLMKWSGANSFRTSHYPYSEELMEEADEQGFLVINEVPAVGLKNFKNDVLLKQHLLTIKELIDRDKNRPSVIAWSIANEPSSDHAEAKGYFETIANSARSADSMMKRPITAALNTQPDKDYAAFSLDLIMFNRYYGWYSDAGYTQVIRGELEKNAQLFHKRFNVPVMISEYGAEALPGMHGDPSFVFTEEYQIEFLTQYHLAFDQLRSQKLLVGELIWNFADFQTIQGITRAGGNRKGIFTRDRKPKTAASVLRCRYWSLAEDSHPSIDQYHRQGVTLCPKVAL